MRTEAVVGGGGGVTPMAHSPTNPPVHIPSPPVHNPLPKCMLGYTLPAQVHAGIHPLPPVDRMTDTCLWKHYLHGR